LALILYINGQLTDLASGQVIAQTKQVNDLNSLDNRQTNYTNKFNLPKTANNVRIMNFLTVTGNQSAVPYQQNSCSLYSETGECFVYNGWAVVTDGGDDYEVVVYDGIIDLYKKIENQTMASLGLDELQHVKNFASIKDSWNELPMLPYRYILADYNGSNGAVNAMPVPEVNIDYLIPSVNVAWLWEKIFSKYGFQPPLGEVFKTDDFKNLWMTYPKGVPTADEGTDVFTAKNYSYFNDPANSKKDPNWRTLIAKYTAPFTANTAMVTPDVNGGYIQIKEPGYYQFYVSGSIDIKEAYDIFMCTNVYTATKSDDAGLNSIIPTNILKVNQQPGDDFDVQTGVLKLNAGARLWLLFRHTHHSRNGSVRFTGDRKWNIEVSLKKIELTTLDFATAFADFSIRDFMQEIVQRFGLTMYKNKYEPKYEFLTLKEQITTPQVQNWSGKFGKKISENYIYGSYAQRNWFRYAYNDKESTYNDFYIDVTNVNLPDSRDVIKSKIYSPDNQTVKYLNQTGNVYRLWDKEAVEDPQEGEPPVNYKPLDKRYYFLRAQQKIQNVKLTSGQIQQSETATSVWVETFNGLSFEEILQNYYLPLQQVLSNAIIVNAELWLTDTDVVNFDFRKLYYIEQLSGYFIMNKINGYVPGKVTKCELVKVLYTAPWVEAPQITIDVVTQFIGSYTYNVFFTAKNVTLPAGVGLTYMASTNSTTWNTVATLTGTTGPVHITAANSDYLYWRITCPALGLTSNTYSY